MISRLKICNFKAIQDAEIVLNGVTLLCGMNGMGKSSIIQVLLLLKQSFLSGDLQKGVITLEGQFIKLGKADDVIAQFGAAKLGKRGITIGLEIDSDNYQEFYFIGNQHEDILALYESPDIEILLQCFSVPIIYLSADRIVPQIQYLTASKNTLDSGQFDIKGQFILQYLDEHKDDPVLLRLQHPSVIEKVKELRKENPETLDEVELLNHVNAWMNEISPGVKIKTGQINEVDALTLRMSYDAGMTNVSTREFRPINTGFGITYILPVVVVLLAAKENDLIIIENPEAHIHPRGQSKIGQLIALAGESGVNILLETHSDHVLNGIRIAVKNGLSEADKINIYFFNREIGSEKHVTNLQRITLDSRGRLSSWPNDFFDEWDKALDQLL